MYMFCKNGYGMEIRDCAMYRCLLQSQTKSKLINAKVELKNHRTKLKFGRKRIRKHPSHS